MGRKVSLLMALVSGKNWYIMGHVTVLNEGLGFIINFRPKFPEFA